MVEKSGEGRAPAAEQAVKAVNLLVQNDYQAHVAKPPEVLPASRIEAAQKAAQAEGPQKGDIFLFGEISSGPMVQVRLTAIDPRDGKIIDDRGFESTSKPADEIVRKTLEEMLPAVEAYWKSRKN
jgi:hypothetical protein